MLKEKVPMLISQINALESLNNSYIKQDSLRLDQIELYKNAYNAENKKYNDLVKATKKNKFYTVLGGIGSFLLGILVCQL